jgi:hypothetical protein
MQAPEEGTTDCGASMNRKPIGLTVPYREVGYKEKSPLEQLEKKLKELEKRIEQLEKEKK